MCACVYLWSLVFVAGMPASVYSLAESSYQSANRIISFWYFHRKRICLQTQIWLNFSKIQCKRRLVFSLHPVAKHSGQLCCSRMSVKFIHLSHLPLIKGSVVNPPIYIASAIRMNQMPRVCFSGTVLNRELCFSCPGIVTC